jgi:hypothetical protein
MQKEKMPAKIVRNGKVSMQVRFVDVIRYVHAIPFVLVTQFVPVIRKGAAAAAVAAVRTGIPVNHALMDK